MQRTLKVLKILPDASIKLETKAPQRTPEVVAMSYYTNTFEAPMNSHILHPEIQQSNQDFFLNFTRREPINRAPNGQTSCNFSLKIIPGESIRNEDVLFGRGKRAQNHIGNMHYREVISAIVKRYKNCSKQEKTALSNGVVYAIHRQGGRFLSPLKKHPNSWVEVNGIALRKKTSQALRDRGLLEKKNAENLVKHVGRFRLFFRERGNP